MTIALFFGTFNPIHIGHLIIANHVSNLKKIDRVWFVVSPRNPFKQKQNLLHEFDRLTLVRLAIADHPKLSASDIEFSLPKPSYTIDTLTALKQKYPTYTFNLIMGADNLMSLPKWKKAWEILSEYHIIVYPRPGFETETSIYDNVVKLDEPLLDISASYIRGLIRQNLSVKYLLPLEVENYIRQQDFYQFAN